MALVSIKNFEIKFSKKNQPVIINQQPHFHNLSFTSFSDREESIHQKKFQKKQELRKKNVNSKKKQNFESNLQNK